MRAPCKRMRAPAGPSMLCWHCMQAHGGLGLMHAWVLLTSSTLTPQKYGPVERIDMKTGERRSKPNMQCTSAVQSLCALRRDWGLAPLSTTSTSHHPNMHSNRSTRSRKRFDQGYSCQRLRHTLSYHAYSPALPASHCSTACATLG